MNRISTNPPYSTNFLKWLPKINRANSISIEIIATIVAISLKVKFTLPPPARKHSMLSSKGRNISCCCSGYFGNSIQKKIRYKNLLILYLKSFVSLAKFLNL